MKRWVIGGAVAFVLLAVALTVPVRHEGTVTVPVTEVAVAEDMCGQVTFSGDLETRRITPVIDLGVLTKVNVALAEPVLEFAGTDACGDVDQLAGGVVLSLPRCHEPNRMSDSEREEFGNARIDGGIAAVVLCEGAAVALMGQTWEPALLESHSGWSDHRFDLGSELVVNEQLWCLSTEYWLEVSSEADGAGTTDGHNPEPVVSTWCTDLVGP